MKHFDFVEIGTADFDTLAHTCVDSFGMSIEPLKFYLDRLPDRSNLIKVNCAVSDSNQDTVVDVFFIPPQVLDENKYLPNWLRGCNSVGKLHHQHHAFAVEHLVETVKIKAVPLGQLLTEHAAVSVDFLKLDTEGMDCAILNSFLDFLINESSQLWPKKIVFETNELTSTEEIQNTIDRYTSYGYNVVRKGDNTELHH